MCVYITTFKSLALVLINTTRLKVIQFKQNYFEHRQVELNIHLQAKSNVLRHSVA